MTRYLTKNSVETLYGYVSITSPAELAFFQVWNRRYGKHHTTCLRPQRRIAQYRVDFAHDLSKTAIEIDGSDHFISPYKINEDKKRQSYIEGRGWRFIRFHSQDVFRDVEACVERVRSVLIATGKFNPTTASSFHPGDRVYDDYCGEGIVLKCEIEASAEFVTIQFQSKRLRFNMSFADLRLQRTSLELKKASPIYQLTDKERAIINAFPSER